MEEADVAAKLKTLSARMDELSDVLVEKKGRVGERMGERMGELSGALAEKRGRAMEKVSKKPFTYMGGAFFGGLALGYLMSRKGKRR
ncbi:hypothetical protein ANME2D_00153 [Candidatus Methanoperedens nitroreducens]|uniref:DUF883 domain-containing protein n=1 Tax=Candidatus Methanoperedens nitratireducens TaxID=1392998 RepID=A0A062VBM2_9EURY|nr:hypothetical protein [Candidatus Methanoperedens nitroreducens]KCZ73094.1 hypothetical protein ANME2D_00153 [Candidatus Methanoperedens nitroreducens]MDJ1422960.1 hypothetical protein [Candidatus Methanoperedens sp.]